MLGAWASSAVSVIKDASGKVIDFKITTFGSGHGDSGNDAVYVYSAATGKFTRALAPWGITPVPVADAVHGENVAGRPGSQHPYQHLHALDSDEPNGPALMQLYGIVGSGTAKSAQAHRFDLVTNTWSRFGDAGTTQGYPQAILKDTKRKLFVRFPSDNYNQFYTLDYSVANPTWKSLSQNYRIGNWSDTYEACACYDPVGDLYIAGTMRGAGANLCWLDANAPTGSWAEITFTGTVPIGIYGTALQYRKADDTFCLIDTSTQPPTGVYILKPDRTGLPSVSRPWVWTRRAFTGTSTLSNISGREWFDRFRIVNEIDALVVVPSPGGFAEAWKL